MVCLKFLKLALCLFVSFMFVCCSSNTNTTYNENDVVLSRNEELVAPEEDEVLECSISDSDSDSDDISDSVTESFGQKIVKTGEIKVKSDNPDSYKQYIDTVIKTYKAYVSSDVMRSNGHSSIFTMTIKVPSKSFESMIIDLDNSLGKVVYKNVNTKDLTAEYADNASRKKTLDAQLEEYRNLMKSAKNVSEIMDIKKHIDRIQLEADAAQSRVKDIDNLVEYSTINLRVSENETESIGSDSYNSLGNRFLRAMSDSLDVLFFLLSIWPVYLIVGIVYYVLRKKGQSKENQKK